GVARPNGRAGKLDPEDQGHRNPAAHHRAHAGSDRLLRLSQWARFRRQRISRGSGLRRRPVGSLFQHAQSLDLRRLERDPAWDHRQGGVGALMDFSYTEEQTLLRDTVARFLTDRYDFETFKRVSRSEPGW